MKKTTCTFCILSSNGYEKKYCMHLCLGKRLQFDAIKCSLGKHWLSLTNDRALARKAKSDGWMPTVFSAEAVI